MIEAIAAAKAFRVPLDLLLALCSVESRLTNAINWYDGGSPSIGVCQMKVRTVRDLGYSPSDLFNYERAFMAAAAYLRAQKDRYQTWPAAVVAYNRGSYRRTMSTKYLTKVLRARRLIKARPTS